MRATAYNLRTKEHPQTSNSESRCKYVGEQVFADNNLAQNSFQDSNDSYLFIFNIKFTLTR